jgi:TupA-like ATPgrasp
MTVITSLRAWCRDAREDFRRRAAAHFVGDRDYVSELYCRKFGRPPNLDRPSGFNEKILVKILMDRRPYLTLFSDKLRVRDHVRKTVPALSLPALFWWSDRVSNFPFAELPDAFVLKANHGSGWNIIVDRKSTVRREDLVAAARKWLRSDFTIVGREWSYQNVHRAIYAEELLPSGRGMPPPDYKLFVFNGKVKIIQVDEGRFVHHTQVLYDIHWNVIEGTVAAAPGLATPPPTTLSAMIAYAEAISLGVDFVRVDLYDIDSRIYFGELTTSPNKGLSPFRPASLDQLFGQYLQLDDYSSAGPAVDYPEVINEPSLLPSDARA